MYTFKFYGIYIDVLILLIGLVLSFNYGLILKGYGDSLGKYIVKVGKLSVVFIPIIILLPVLKYVLLLKVEPLIYEPESTTILGEYRLEHYKKNKNFTYPGTAH